MYFFSISHHIPLTLKNSYKTASGNMLCSVLLFLNASYRTCASYTDTCYRVKHVFYALLDDICNGYSICMMFLLISVMIIMITIYIK